MGIIFTASELEAHAQWIRSGRGYNGTSTQESIDDVKRAADEAIRLGALLIAKR